MFALLFLLLSQVWADTVSTISVNTGATDSSTCKGDVSAVVCSTLAKAYAIQADNTGVTTITVAAAIASAKTSFVQKIERDLTVDGVSGTNNEVTLDGAALTIEKSGITVTVSNFAVKVSTADANFATVKVGTLTLTSVAFDKSGATAPVLEGNLIETATTGLLECTLTGGNTVSVTFENINVKSGALLKGVMAAAGDKFVADVAITSCLSVAAGATLIDLSISTAPTAATQLPTANKLTFTTCYDAEKSLGSLMKITTTAAVAVADSVKAFFGETVSRTYERGQIVDKDGKDLNRLVSVIVNSGTTGDETAACGTSAKPCKSIAKAKLSTLYTAGIQSISYGADYEITDETISGFGKLALTGGKVKLSDSMSGAYITETTGEVLSLFSLNLVYSKVAKSEKTASTASFLSVGGGIAYLDTVTLTGEASLTMSGASLAVTPATVYLKGCTFTGISSSVALVSGYDKIQFETDSSKTKNTFSSITRVGGGSECMGGAVCEWTATTFSLENVKFDGCTTSKAKDDKSAPKAGAIYANAAFTSFTFDNVEFTAGEGDAVAKNIYFGGSAHPTPADLAYFWWGKTGATGLFMYYQAKTDTVAEADVDLTTEITLYVNKATKAPSEACGKASALDAEGKDGPCLTFAAAVASTVYTTDGATLLSIAGDLDVQESPANIDRYAKVTGSGVVKYGKGGLFTTSGDNVFEFDVDGVTINYAVKKAAGANAATTISGKLFDLGAAYGVVVLSSVKVGVDSEAGEIEVSDSAIKQSGGKLAMVSCTFTAIPMKTVPLVDAFLNKDAFVTTGCTFDGITRQSGNGTVFEFKLSDAKYVATIAGATFKDCKALGGNGGAIAVTGTAGSVTLGAATSAVTFSGCSAAKLATDTANTTGFGGAIYTDAIDKITFTNVEFTSFGTAELYGAGLYVTGEKATVAVAKLYKPFLNRDRTAGQFIVHYTETPEGETEAKDFYKNAYELCISAGTAYVSDAGKSGDECSADPEKDKDRETCATILDGLKTFYGSSSAVDVAGSDTPYAETAGYTFVRKVALTASGEKTATAKIALYTTATTSAGVYVIGTSAVSTTVSFTKINYNADDTAAEGQVSVPLFTVVNGELTLASMAITASATTHGALSTGVLKASSTGKLTLTTVTISSFTLANSPLLEVPFDKLTITPAADASAVSTFKTITRNSGNGAVMQVAVADGTAFAMEGIVCESCIAKNGNGGAFYIDYQGGDLTFGNQAEEQKKENVLTNFTKCEAQAASQPEPTNAYEEPTAGAGGAIYVKITKVPNLADNANKFAFKNLVITECKASKEEYGAGIFATSSDATATDIVLKNSTVWGNVASLSDTKIYFEDAEGNKGSTGSNVVIIVVIIVVVVVVVVIIIVVVIVVVCCCCKKD